MLLTIDIGNTNTVLGIFDGDEMVDSWRVKTDARDTADELWLQYRSLITGYTVTGLSVCSTVPAVLREARSMISRYFQEVRTTIIEPGVKTGVPLLVDNPKEIGADRIVNTLAALRKVELVKPKSVIGKNTVEALQSGTIYGFAGQVDGLVNRISDELDALYPDNEKISVIATGGLAPLVLGISETIDYHEPDLTLIGLRLVHERNG